MPGTLKKCGHRLVNLRRDNHAYPKYVHRLVAFAFIGEPPTGKHHVAHWDGDSSNNQVSNLRWATPAENSADSIRLGRSKRPGGQNHFRAKLSIEDLPTILSLKGEKSSRVVATEFGVTHGTILGIWNGRSYKRELASL